MSKNYFIRVGTFKNVREKESFNVILLCEEHDTYRYQYRCISTIPDDDIELLALFIDENSNNWVSDWRINLDESDYICIGANKYQFKDIKDKVNKIIEKGQ